MRNHLRTFLPLLAVTIGLVLLPAACGANDERGLGDAPVGKRDEAPRRVWVMPDQFPNLTGVCIGGDLVLVTTREAAPVVLADNPECAS